MPDSLAAGLSEVVADAARVLTAPAVLDRLSHDFYWYSPVLRPKLASKTADVAVQPGSVKEVMAVLSYAGRREVPVTVRGAGTGNYGQCVPLEGGIVLDLSLMDKLEEITPDGVAVCQPGLRLGVLETEARKKGWELRIYPSTLVKASVGGFLAGGSGGIGSVTHGGLRDFDTVRASRTRGMAPATESTAGRQASRARIPFVLAEQSRANRICNAAPRRSEHGAARIMATTFMAVV